MLKLYFDHETKRKSQGIPPLPLSPEETQEVCSLLEKPPEGKEELLLYLLKNRVGPGVDSAAKVKAAWLTNVAKGVSSSPVLSKQEAVFLLGTMLGGYNVEPLLELWEGEEVVEGAPEALKKTTLLYILFEKEVGN